MLVKFKDNTTKLCQNPTEQKLFKNGEPIGWVCALVIMDDMSSTEIDNLITPENFSELDFFTDDGTELFQISGYEKITSLVVRHGQPTGTIEIQLTKGV